MISITDEKLRFCTRKSYNVTFTFAAEHVRQTYSTWYLVTIHHVTWVSLTMIESACFKNLSRVNITYKDELHWLFTETCSIRTYTHIRNVHIQARKILSLCMTLWFIAILILLRLFAITLTFKNHNRWENCSQKMTIHKGFITQLNNMSRRIKY